MLRLIILHQFNYHSLYTNFRYVCNFYVVYYEKKYGVFDESLHLSNFTRLRTIRFWESVCTTPKSVHVKQIHGAENLKRFPNKQPWNLSLSLDTKASVRVNSLFP